MFDVSIYTDGSCLKNPGVGGWAYVLRYEDKQKIGSGAVEYTTNNRMELLSVIMAIRSLKKPCSITLYSDSNLVVRTINEWIYGWEKKGFKDKKNVDLLKEYLELIKPHKIKAIWVKAHNGDELNELCDTLARNEALKLQERLKNV